ncbi:Phage tail assembly chaperone protein, E, or 41 or 14 [Hyphomicrobium sp. 1Nfss2.1]|uniref:hypothetical protein n=1 Tax=Hyphomicrobium sp. 1Nfss2.1 TaxID=3413936 RepID=UPI003C7C5C95
MSKLQLRHPVHMPDGSIIKALIARRPTSAEIEHVKSISAPSGRDLRLSAYAHFTDVDRMIIDELDLEDLLRLDDLLSELFYEDKS